MKKHLVAAVSTVVGAAMFVWVACSPTTDGQAAAPTTQAVVVTSSSTTTTLPPTTSTSTTTTTIPPTTTTFVLPGGPWRCPEWHQLALDVGWPVEDLPTLDRVMWKETRCDPSLRSTSSDSGLTQINDVHLDWLWDQYGITQEALFDPAVNLTVALWIHDYADKHYGCGWQPWRLSC